jgi:hypothetical protein
MNNPAAEVLTQWLLSMFLLLSLGQYLCWWTIYVFITITGLIPLLVDYLCLYYYHWANTFAVGLSMFLLPSLGWYLCWWTISVLLLSLGIYLYWWTIYVLITITGPIPLLVDYYYFFLLSLDQYLYWWTIYVLL